jgi:hypothetical protein
MEYAQLKPGPGFQPVRSFLYYVQRLVTQQRLRQWIAGSIAASIRIRKGSLRYEQPSAIDDQAALRSLTESGYAPLQTLLNARQVADIHSFLRDKLLIDRRNRKHMFAFDDVGHGAPMGDYSLRDIIDCPHILELANSPSLLRLASQYIGCKPTISAMVLRWSFPSSALGTGVQGFHRDSDDWRFVKIFVYLTDVDAKSGPHVYVRGSHLTQPTIRLYPYSDQEVEQTYGSESVIAVTGSSGFGFAVNTHGIHKGMVPTERPRLLLQIQYSLLPVYAYRYRPEPYSGHLKLDRYINRFMVR